MGFVKQTKSDVLAGEARRAVEEGRSVFAPMLNTPWTQHSMSGAISGWAEMIEAVEAAGWTLTHWTVAQDHKGRRQAYPLFRRVITTKGN